MYQSDYQNLHGLTEEGMAQRISELSEFAAQPGHRKRTHSASEGGIYARDTPYASSKGGSWSAEVARQQGYGVAGMGGPQTPQPQVSELSQISPNSWRYGAPESSRRDSSFAQYEPDARDAEAMPLDWDESVVDEYYRMIHPTFPLLTHSKLRLRARLVGCCKIAARCPRINDRPGQFASVALAHFSRFP